MSRFDLRDYQRLASQPGAPRGPADLCIFNIYIYIYIFLLYFAYVGAYFVILGDMYPIFEKEEAPVGMPHGSNGCI